MNAHEFNSDSEWQAYRYVSRDMSEQEQQAFELKLTADPDLCAIVADLQMLCDAVVAGETAAARRRMPSLPAVWMRKWTTVAILGLLAMTIWLATRPSPVAEFIRSPVTHVVSSVPSLVDARVLTVWSALQPEPHPGEAAIAFEEDAAVQVPIEVAVPDWMLAAVASTAAANGEIRVPDHEGLLPDMNETRGAGSL